MKLISFVEDKIVELTVILTILAVIAGLFFGLR